MEEAALEAKEISRRNQFFMEGTDEVNFDPLPEDAHARCVRLASDHIPNLINDLISTDINNDYDGVDESVSTIRLTSDEIKADIRIELKHYAACYKGYSYNYEIDPGTGTIKESFTNSTYSGLFAAAIGFGSDPLVKMREAITELVTDKTFARTTDDKLTVNGIVIW